MLDKIFKEEGQVIPGLVLYEKIRDRLEADPQLQSLLSVDYLRKNFNNISGLTTNVIMDWSSLLGIKIIDTSLATYTGFNSGRASVKRFYRLSRGNSGIRKNPNGSISVMGLMPIRVGKELLDDGTLDGSESYRTDITNITFHFMPIPENCSTSNEYLINRLLRSAFMEYTEALSEPPSNVIKAQFKELYSKEDKEEFLKIYNKNNLQGVLDFFLKREATTPELQNLIKRVNEKIA